MFTNVIKSNILEWDIVDYFHILILSGKYVYRRLMKEHKVMKRLKKRIEWLATSHGVWEPTRDRKGQGRSVQIISKETVALMKVISTTELWENKFISVWAHCLSYMITVVLGSNIARAYGRKTHEKPAALLPIASGWSRFFLSLLTTQVWHTWKYTFQVVNIMRYLLRKIHLFWIVSFASLANDNHWYFSACINP